MQFQDKLKDLIDLFKNWLSDPQDSVQLEQVFMKTSILGT